MSDINEIMFEDFVELVGALKECDGHKERTSMISRFIREETNGSLHKDTALILKLLLPKTSQRKFNIKDKQFINYFSEIFDADKDDMLESLEKGDVAITLCDFFKKSDCIKPLKSSTVSLKQVDEWLDELSSTSGNNAAIAFLTKCTKRCTADDFLILMRLIKKDLNINVGVKQVLDALDAKAYSAFQASHDLPAVVEKLRNVSISAKPQLKSKELSVSIKLMTPVKPMLAEPGRSVDSVISKASDSSGLLVEIKYDGERVQMHKQGSKFAYFSRSLKPVQPHKVEHLKEYIPKAFPGVADLILDSEVLLIDTNMRKPREGHKKSAFKDVIICIFVFDCLYINGRSLLLEPMYKRREILEQNMVVVPNRVLLSEKHDVKTKEDLNELMARVFAEGLEGLVIKPNKSIYEPGKRHWIKIKKDYLGEGAMADSADLIVLGAYYGTGKKGGLKSVFLMGAYDPETKKFCTVTKVGNGLDNRSLSTLNKKDNMIKISKDYSKVPSWLNVNRSIVPDFVVKDPKKSDVWEITGAEFSRAGTHTAGASITQDGISIRFPRFTRFRNDKTWLEATDVPQLKALLDTSYSQCDWSKRLNTISKPSNKLGTREALKRAMEEDSIESEEPAKKPRLLRVRSAGQHTHLRSLLESFVIQVPKALIGDSSFDQLYRRLVACGATVVGEGLLQSQKTPTHVIIWPDSSESQSSPSNLTHLTVDWLNKSIDTNKLQPLPLPLK